MDLCRTSAPLVCIAVTDQLLYAAATAPLLSCRCNCSSKGLKKMVKELMEREMDEEVRKKMLKIDIAAVTK
ncbi:hypothetical protein U1Q18_021415 [Sarracenia purpurea var. burkii]